MITGPSAILVSIDGPAIAGSLVSQLCTFAHSDETVSDISESGFWTPAIGYWLSAIW